MKVEMRELLQQLKRSGITDDKVRDYIKLIEISDRTGLGRNVPAFEITALLSRLVQHLDRHYHGIRVSADFSLRAWMVEAGRFLWHHKRWEGVV